MIDWVSQKNPGFFRFESSFWGSLKLKTLKKPIFWLITFRILPTSHPTFHFGKPDPSLWRTRHYKLKHASICMYTYRYYIHFDFRMKYFSTHVSENKRFSSSFSLLYRKYSDLFRLLMRISLKEKLILNDLIYNFFCGFTWPKILPR